MKKLSPHISLEGDLTNDSIEIGQYCLVTAVDVAGHRVGMLEPLEQEFLQYSDIGIPWPEPSEQEFPTGQKHVSLSILQACMVQEKQNSILLMMDEGYDEDKFVNEAELLDEVNHMAKHNFDHLANKLTICKFQGFEPTQTDLDSVVMTVWLRPGHIYLHLTTTQKWWDAMTHELAFKVLSLLERFRINKDRPSECAEFKKCADQSHDKDMAKIIQDEFLRKPDAFL
ncbi:hypothetical protein BDR06DRAFT_1060683 [Suillus hirtellus]|nr:hypothetical protein BDR06DRAFT_1060683 [Suillus hirtellus]